MNRIRWPDAAGAALLAGAAGLLLLVTSAGLPLVRWSYDLLFALRPDIPVDGVMIVQMDEESHRRLGQPGTGPWNRELHARLIDQLTTLGARAVAFDVLFLGEGEPTADARLVQAAKAS